MKRMLSTLVVVLVLLAAFAAPAAASGLKDGKVVVGGTFTLAQGEVLDGDLAVLGGVVRLEAESRVNGDVFLMGGTLRAEGEVNGDVTAVGGILTLDGTAVVGGDLNTIGSVVHREAGARIDGRVTTGEAMEAPLVFPFIERLEVPAPMIGEWRAGLAPVLKIGWLFFRAIMLAALAVLVIMFWPDAARRVSQAAVGQPIIAGGLGVLTALAAPLLLVLLAITILLIPVSLIAALALVAGVVFGWLALGLEVGLRMARSFNWALHPAAAAGVGTLVLTLVVDGIGFLPCVGWLAPFIVGTIGLGAVILTRFGSQTYLPAGPSAPLTPADDPSAGEADN
jgi:cytoskeletal protein CcmA (bactofilin family)